MYSFIRIHPCIHPPFTPRSWVDPDNDASNGVDPLCQADMLRLDAMVMTVQLNLRKLLEDQERPSMNIICQKACVMRRGLPCRLGPRHVLVLIMRFGVGVDYGDVGTS
jgi:hypothetical protein